MCGILGCVQHGSLALEHDLMSMLGPLRHRGPDAEGIWLDTGDGVALGHTRLSILDLSENGRQPMTSPSGRYVLTYNGEIYNFANLRSELIAQGCQFRGHSDTEVFLSAVEEFGVIEAAARSDGMFALAVWDRRDKELWLIRDRAGIKPLYYGWNEKSFLFASEPSAFRRHPDFGSVVNRSSLALLLQYSYIPTPHCIWEGFFKLPPACALRLRLEDLRRRPAAFAPSAEDQDYRIRPKYYWDLRSISTKTPKHKLPAADLIEELDAVLRRSVQSHLVSDVPLGAFLSGGVDSSLIVALMHAAGAGPVKTFTIGFKESEFDEAGYAAQVAQHLGAEHTELYVSPRQALDVVQDLPRIYSEPFADSSQIPTILVSRLARTKVTVSLSGDGGDELFGGYERYKLGRTLWRLVGWLPFSCRRLAGQALLRSPSWAPRAAFELLRPLFPFRFQKMRAGRKYERGARFLESPDFEALYNQMVSHWLHSDQVVLGAKLLTVPLTDRRRYPQGLSVVERMQYLDLLSFLPDEILVKLDRASMSVSLEGRVPFMDRAVVEYAWRLSDSDKIRGTTGKQLLRSLLSRYLPFPAINRPKQGFSVPMETWLRGDLRPWAESLLSEKRLVHDGFFNPAAIREKWQEHISGRENWMYQLWSVLMFQAWWDENRP